MTRAPVLIIVLLTSVLSNNARGDWKAPDHWDGNYLYALALPQDQQPPSFGTLRASHVPSREAAEKVAKTYWINRMRADETTRVVGLYQVAHAIGDFAVAGSWIWEVHKSTGPGIDAIIFIDAQTKNIYAVESGSFLSP
jgi:hypothetical protein